MAETDHPSNTSREVIEKRGGHTSGSTPYTSLPEVSTRPAVGAWAPTPDPAPAPQAPAAPQPAPESDQ